MPTGFRRIAAAIVAVAVATTPCSRLAQAQSAPAWAHPAGTTTGIMAVDATLRAIESHDSAALEALFRFTSRPCTEAGVGEVPCPVGQPVGTAVDVFTVSSCEGAAVLPGDPELHRLAGHIAARELYVYAVARLSAEWQTGGRSYVVYLGSPNDPGTSSRLPLAEQAVSVFTDSEGIRGISIGCGQSVAREAERDLGPYILAPKSAPGAPNTGTGMGDVRHAGSAWVLALITSVAAGCVAAATYKLARAGGMESRA